MIVRCILILGILKFKENVQLGIDELVLPLFWAVPSISTADMWQKTLSLPFGYS